MSYFNAPNSISAGAPTHIPLGEFTALPPKPPTGFEGVLLLREGNGKKEKGRKGEEGRRKETEKVASWLLMGLTSLMSCIRRNAQNPLHAFVVERLA